MAQALTLRVPDSDANEVRRIALRERRSVSEVGARILDEWLRMNRFPQIEFRSVQGERTACVKGRLEVWQVILVARHEEYDPARTAEHLRLTIEQAEAAIRYYRTYPAEIDVALAENDEGSERLNRLLPNVETVDVA